MLSPSLRESGVTVSVQTSRPTSRASRATPDLIKQVFINLISNAIKYSPRGTTVTVRAREEAVNIVVSVADQGVGIPQDELGNVFDKYFRARSQKHVEDGGARARARDRQEHRRAARRRPSASRARKAAGSTFYFTLPREHCFNDLIGYIGEVVDAREQLHEMLELIVRMIAELLNAQARVAHAARQDPVRSCSSRCRSGSRSGWSRTRA